MCYSVTHFSPRVLQRNETESIARSGRKSGRELEIWKDKEELTLGHTEGRCKSGLTFGWAGWAGPEGQDELGLNITSIFLGNETKNIRKEIIVLKKKPGIVQWEE